MIRISDAADVIQSAREDAEQAAGRIKIAERIYDDFAGRKDHGGLSVYAHGSYVVVCDSQDRWLAERDSYDAALVTVIEAVIAGKITDDDSDAYELLCRECPAMYSVIGHGSHNSDEAGLLSLLGETLEQDDLEEIARFLGIEIPEVEVDADSDDE